VHISGASRAGLLAWRRRPRATRTAIHPHLHDRLRPAQPGVRHPHLPHPPPGIPRQRRPVPQRLVHRTGHHRTRRHARPAHQPAPSTKATPARLSSIAIAAITITLPDSPLAGPLGLTAVPAWILAALAGLTAFYVIANQGGQTSLPTDDPIHNPASTVALDELIAQHTTRPAAISACQPDRPPPAAGDAGRAGARPPPPAAPPEPVHLLAARGAPDRARAGKLGQGCLPRVVRRGPGRRAARRALGQVPGPWSRSAMITSRCRPCAGEPGGTAGRLFPLLDADIAVIRAGTPRPPADRSHRRCRGRPRTTSIDSITVSNEKGQAERSSSRLWAALAGTPIPPVP
jgi:hypothetical protein